MSLEKLERRDIAADAAQLLGRLYAEAGVASDAVSVPIEIVGELVERAFSAGQTVVWNQAHLRRTCRVCGCWELEACDSGCWWVSSDLCSSCGEDDDQASRA